MVKFLLHVLINAVGIYVAVLVLNGRGLAVAELNWVTFALLGLIFGVVTVLARGKYEAMLAAKATG